MISNLFPIFCIVQNDTLHLVGNIFSCVLFEKGSYGIYRTVNFSDEIQRLYIGASAKPRYTLVCAVLCIVAFILGVYTSTAGGIM